MVTDEIRDRRSDDRSPNNRLDRGQVILIGAVALAFIILGVVVVFNGVLYTETLSSADTGQSASDAERTELEVRQGVGCILSETDGEDQIKAEISAFNQLYQNATAESHSAAVNIRVIEPGPSNTTANVSITYDSADLSYDRNLTINDTCGGNP